MWRSAGCAADAVGDQGVFEGMTRVPPPPPKVEVIVCTYNHEPYIRQALDSIIMQETDFRFQITILEDFSTDGTREIVRQYGEEFPDLIKLDMHDRNLCSSRPHMDAIAASNATYIAVMDGDDYWTSKDKLRSQVACLDENPDCAVCFHNVEVDYEDPDRESHLKNSKRQRKFTTIHNLFERNYIATCSVMYRRDALTDIPEWFANVEAADWHLHLLAARHGRIVYIADAMGVYRVHSRGYWSGMAPEQQWRYAIDVLEAMFWQYPDLYHRDISRGLENAYQYIAHAQAATGDLQAAMHSLHQARSHRDAPPEAHARARIIDVRCNGLGVAEPAGTETALVALDIECESVRPTSFVVMSGRALPTVYGDPTHLCASVPSCALEAPGRLTVSIMDINGESDPIDLVVPQ